VALGGLIQNQVNKRKSGVPILSDIAGLGLLLSTTNDTTMRTELLVLIIGADYAAHYPQRERCGGHDQ
jgi:type II secretory pathway component GspD/PulD (secretin)